MRITALLTAGLLASALTMSSNPGMTDEKDDYSSGFGLIIVVKYGEKEMGKECKFIDKKVSKYEQVYYAKKIDAPPPPGKSDQEPVKCEFKDDKLKYEKEKYGFPCKKIVIYEARDNLPY